MTRAGRRERRDSGTSTRRRIIDAALETLTAVGFAGASARAIAERGGINQALIFYHFGTVNDLLLAALDETSRRRLAQYEATLGGVRTVPELLEAAARLYREDLAAGHITVLNEMIGASLTYPSLRAEIAGRVEPWVRFAEAVIDRVTGDGPLPELVSSHDAARTAVALYLGMQMLTHLNGDDTAAEALFATGRRLASLFATP
jgi:AcrR family transcriptional regulator